MRAVIISGILFLFYLPAIAQKIDFHGTISNEQGKGLAFAVLWVNNVYTGTSTNEQGVFHLKLNPGTYTVSFRKPDYETLTQTLAVNGSQPYNIRLNTLKIPLTANIADSIIHQVIIHSKAHSRKQPGYTGRLYCKQLQQLDGAPKAFMKKDIALVLHLDSNRRGIISLSESISQFHTRSTDHIREDVDAAKMTNDSNVFRFNSAAELHIDFYKNTLILPGLTDHGFLSPIADRAPSHYRYHLAGVFTDQGKRIFVINVQPRHRNEHLFKGLIYVVDKQWLLYSVDLHLGHDGHIDFVDSVRIQQQFTPVADSNWVVQAMNFRFYGKLLGFKYSGYFLQLYQNIITDTTQAGTGKQVYFSTRDDYRQTDQFWLQSRPVQLLSDESNFYQAMLLAQRHKRDKTLADSIQNTGNRFKFIPYFFNGYTLHNYRESSFWTFPAPTNMVFYNTVEGLGIDLFAKYKKVYNNEHSLTIIPNARYGNSDKVLNTNVFVDYVYNPFSQSSVYGRVGSDFLDLNDKGTISPFINSLSTLLLGNNYIKLYQSKFIMVGTTKEVTNGVLLNGQIEYDERHPLFNTTNTFNKDSVYLTSNNPLDPNGNTPLFPPYRALIVQGSATFTFDQEYKINPSGKYILPNPYPRVRFNYRMGIPALGSDVNYEFVSVDVFQDRLNMGIYGYTGYFLSTGRFLNTRSLYYPDYNQFSGGQSFFFDANLGSFHFLNYYTYSTDKPYFEAHIEHNFTGYFFSKVPLLRKLNLQEIIGGSYLHQGTLPDYKEVYVGIKRTVIRLDYGLAFGRFTQVVQGFRLIYNL